MRTNNTRQMAHTLTDLIEDIWQKRHKLIDERGKGIYLPFRITMTDHVKDVTFTTYVHAVISRDRWWATVNEKAYFDYDNHNELVGFSADMADSEQRYESWRHYAFKDVLRDIILTKLDEDASKISEGTQPFLWDMFPLEELRLSALPKESEIRYNSDGLIPMLEAVTDEA